MRTGKIQSEWAERRLDQGQRQHALWEQGTPAPVELAWSDADKLTPDEIREALAGARSAALVVGTAPESRRLLEATLLNLAGDARLYAYADRTLENDRTILRRLTDMATRVLPRLGPRPPADWLVVDRGRAALLLLGPDADRRRWSMRLDGSLARALFDAFAALFWHHAAREFLPDQAGVAAWRTPLHAPFPAPGPHVRLAAGDLYVGTAGQDPIVDAELRVTPRHADPGPARRIVLPPRTTDAAVDLGLPNRLTQRGSQVRWTDLGLPPTAITRERMRMDLAADAMTLSLEWPRGDAVDCLHRITRATDRPAWQFHPHRSLVEIQGQVLLHGADAAHPVEASVTRTLHDVSAPLLAFDAAAPAQLPEPPPLAREVVHRWRRVPVEAPAGARTAELVERWRKIDEWAAARVDRLRAALQPTPTEQGLLARLSRWLPGRDAAAKQRRRLLEDVEELGDGRPSEDPAHAADRLRELEARTADVERLLHATHDQHQRAEDAAAEELQRSQWQARIDAAAANLAHTREQLAAAESAHGAAARDLASAEATRAAAVDHQRQARRAELAAAQGDMTAELAETRRALDLLKEKHGDRPPKQERQPLTRKQQDLEKKLAQARQDLEAVARWSPPPALLADVDAAVQRARQAVEDAARITRGLQDRRRGYEAEHAEVFRFLPPTRLQPPPLVESAAAPPVPTEAPPELGELRELKGQRYLGVSTWEQVPLAAPIAQRLNAELVVLPPGKK